MSGLPLYGVDAFTDRPFAGNPAAVVPLEADGWPDPAWMQALATELGWSETAFVRRCGPAGGAFALRWFTPGAEVELCGHATVATAHVLWASGRLEATTPAVFETLSGPLTAARLADGAIELDFPALPGEPAPIPDGMLEALGLEAGEVEAVLRSRFDVMVVLAAPSTVQRLTPTFAALAALDARGVIVTAPGPHDGADFVSRFFAPAVGVDEDPVTGSAHCVLGPYWSVRLGRDRLRARQLSARGGDLQLRLRGDRVGIAGHAVTVYEGRLHV
jgi:PhzF family phenazine biosynthesis protein